MAQFYDKFLIECFLYKKLIVFRSRAFKDHSFKTVDSGRCKTKCNLPISVHPSCIYNETVRCLKYQDHQKSTSLTINKFRHMPRFQSVICLSRNPPIEVLIQTLIRIPIPHIRSTIKRVSLELGSFLLAWRSGPGRYGLVLRYVVPYVLLEEQVVVGQYREREQEPEHCEADQTGFGGEPRAPRPELKWKGASRYVTTSNTDNRFTVDRFTVTTDLPGANPFPEMPSV